MHSSKLWKDKVFFLGRVEVSRGTGDCRGFEANKFNLEVSFATDFLIRDTRR